MTPLYQLHNIQVFRQQRCILDIEQLSLAKSECVALLGDNGSGKSTLLDLLGFTQGPSQGSIEFNGQSVQMPIPSQARRKIGYVNQHPLLLRGSVKDNLQLALNLQGIDKSQHERQIEQALSRVNLSHAINQPAEGLSGGELKRVAIARAICYQPDVVLLDEPFSHLDQSSSQQLESIIAQLSQESDTTVIFSSHNRLQGIALADRVINLVNGHTTQSPLINVFSGRVEQNHFTTGKMNIEINDHGSHAQHIAIDPHQIIVSHQQITSSMRNNFQGRITSISEQENQVCLSIDCHEIFHAIISHNALEELQLSLGSTVWISFKSTAVNVF